jgi:hypothetical protein
MRPILLLALIASAPAGAQSAMPPIQVTPQSGPNARVAQPPLGPNARAAQRPVGPNGEIARSRKLLGEEISYPSCAAARTVRATPIRRGEPGYGPHLDRDGDGIACE